MKTRLHTLTLRAMLALALTLPAAAQATPVTILSGQTMLFNFDMTGAAPAPPYTRVELNFGVDLAASTATDALYEVFTELEGNGSLGGGPISVVSLASILASDEDPEFVDGLFSFTIKALDGDLTMDAKVQGVLVIPRGEFRTDFIEPVVRLIDSTAPGTVPEPSTVALVLLAAAAMAARGGRRASRRRLAAQATLAGPVPA